MANRLGIGLRSREWEFDRKLHRLLEPINQAINAEPRSGSAPERDAWQHRLLSDIDVRLERLDRLRAPTEEWSTVAAAYHDVYESIADVYRTGEDPTSRAEIKTRSAAVTARREALRTAYREGAANRLGANRMARIMRDLSADLDDGGGAGSKDTPEEGQGLE